MARLYANENFPRQTVEFLRSLGHDVLTVAEAGNAGAAIPDPEVLAFAIQEQRAVITLNRRDFVRLHYSTAFHTGIIVCSLNTNYQQQADQIHQALMQNLDLSRVLLRINLADTRIEIKAMLFPTQGDPTEGLADAIE